MNTGTKWIVLFHYILLMHFYSFCEGGGKLTSIRSRHRPSVSTTCPIPKLKNGTVRMQRGGRMGYFFCANGFDIHGPMNIVCQMGRWKQEIPKCLKSGCKQPQPRSNGHVMIDEKKQQAMLFCQDDYLSAGSTNAFCDGSEWDRELGECRPDVQHTKSCDFETSDLCEWTQDGENDFPWVRRNGWTSFEKLEFGPKHDHTTGKPLHGYYMVAEATNSRTTQRSRFWSPVYNQSDSENACFRFYYHMYGSKIGRLRVLYKPIDQAFDYIVDDPKYSLFEISDTQGNRWNEAFFEIEPTPDQFQIIFEASGSNGLINDIAIDDVALLNGGACLQFVKTKVTNEEVDGIFDIQSCANRCNETESVRINGSTTFNQNGKIIEKCDCHLDCLELDTCCIDFQLKCLESEPSEMDSTTTPFNDVSSESSVLDETSTSSTEKNESNNETQDTSTIISSVLTTTPKIVIPSTLKIITTSSTTPKTMTTASANLLNITSATIHMPTLTLNSTTTKSTTPTPTTFKSALAKNSTTMIPSTISVKFPVRTVKLINITSTTPNSVVKILSTSVKPKTVRTVVPKQKSTLAIKPIKFDHKDRIKTTSTSKSMPMPITSTDSTLNAQIMPITDSSGIPKISIIIAICVMLSAMLFAWKYFNANKWNNFNSHQIEFKSNYPTEGTEESLIRSDSFLIDTDFINDDYRNGDDGIDDDGDIVNESDENTNADGDSDNVNEYSQNGMKSKCAATKVKFMKNSNRSGRVCDQYSEKRCLMNSTIDDEQFDFTLQTTL